MTQRFILDENAVILAQKGKDERGERDATSARLLSDIIQICHTLVLDYGLWGKYLTQLGGSGRSEMLRVFRDAFQTEGKIELRKNAQPFPEESAVPVGSRDDIPLVRLAVETGAALVTTDQPLRDALNSSGITETYELSVLSPTEALESL